MQNNATNEFSLAGYRALLAGLFEHGYSARDFSNYDAGSSHLILRHDIDMSISAACEVAALERDIGVTSTYFVLLRSELYSPFSESGRAELIKLVELGHEVGLHLDASLYADDTAALDEAAAWECDLLERLIGRPVRIISLHRPAQSLINTQNTLGRRPHTYQQRYFSDIGYCSDSRGAWGYGHPYEHQAVQNKSALQLLTHPIWWTGEAVSPKVRLDRYLRGRHETLGQALADNCGIFDNGGMA